MRLVWNRWIKLLVLQAPSSSAARWVSSKLRHQHPQEKLINYGNFSLDYLIDRIWADLNLVKIYTKKRGAHPDLDDPVCLRKGATIEVSDWLLLKGLAVTRNEKAVCNGIHRSLAENFKYGLVW